MRQVTKIFPLTYILLIFLTIFASCSRAGEPMGGATEIVSVTEPSFMKCDDIVTPGPRQQASFNGILAGQSTQQVVLNSLGEPNHIYDSSYPNTLHWSYSDFSIWVKEGLVYRIWHHDVEEMKSFKYYLSTYGCPNAILQSGPGDENPGGKLLFVFSDIGFDVQFEGTHIKVTDRALSTMYFAPMDFSSYLDQFALPGVKQLSWDQAVSE